MNIDEIFINLYNISQIKSGNKLVQKHNFIMIDTSYFKPITRFYNNINRFNTINFISFVYNKAFILYYKILEQNYINLIIRLQYEFKNSLCGLLNLKQTYFNDCFICKEINIIINNINNVLITNQKYNNILCLSNTISTII